MSTNNKFSEPTAEEMNAYFDGFPSVKHTSASIAPRALFLADSHDGKNSADSQAQVGKYSPTVIAFGDGVSKENRDAVMWGVAWAEYAAGKSHDINEQPIKWLEEYSKALFNCGWSMVGGYEYGEYKTNNSSLTMDSVVLELIGAIAGPNAATVIQLLSLTLDKMQGNKPLMQLFERNSKKGKRGTCRVMPCVESATGIPITYLVSMHCEYSDEAGGALFWKWEVRKLSIKRLAKGVEFFKARYELAEPKIKSKLGIALDDYFDGF